MSRSENDGSVEDLASTIEDLLKMGIIRINDTGLGKSERAILTTPFSLILSKFMVDQNITKDDRESLLKAIYLAFLIYLGEHLKIPKSMTVALANDIEKFQERSELSIAIGNYILVLYNIIQKI